MADDTQIDALPTPGPVFAYRAFRNFVWGSPETSPLRPPSHDKENLRPADSLVKRKSLDVEVKLTPKRQKIVPVSPTKSILRNGNEHTPRQALLRHVNVTFQDARRATSPELAGKASSLTAVRSASTHQIVALQPRLTAAQSDTTSQESNAPPSSKITLDLKMEAYKESTEKEMRKLLKYSQKMREQARRSDEENASLRALLEEARRENARLSQQLAERDKKDSLRKTSHRESRTHEAEMINVRAVASKPATRQQHHQLDQVEPANPHLAAPKSSTKHQDHQRDYEDNAIKARQSQTRILRPTSTQEKPAKRKASASVDLLAEIANTTEQLNKVYLPDMPPPHMKRAVEMRPRRLEDDAVRHPGATTQKETTKDSLAAQRQAAARERLNAKRQARLASSQIKLGDINRTEMNKDEGIDWLNI